MFILIISPTTAYTPTILADREYARRCLRDALIRGEAPVAPYLHYDGALESAIPTENALRRAAVEAIMLRASAIVAYLDRGWTDEMRHVVGRARALHVHVIERKIGV
jgi:hypothetical protein